MDPIDVRIYCEMAFRDNVYERFTERRPSAAEIGERLGLDEKTVRVRVNRMERSGFIRYYQATPNLALFGMRTASLFRFEALNLPTKFAIINGLQKVPRLVEAADYFGPFLTCTIAGASSAEAKREADALTSHYELSTIVLGNTSINEPTTRLDLLDWKIMKGLRYDARSTDKALAESLPATERMVRYRLSKLLTTDVVQMRPIIDPRKQAGLVFYELELTIDEKEHSNISRWLKRKHEDKLWKVSNPRQGVILASLFCFTLAEPEESVMESLQQQGVKRCVIFVLKEMLEPQRPNWIDSLIELRINAQQEEPTRV